LFIIDVEGLVVDIRVGGTTLGTEGVEAVGIRGQEVSMRRRTRTMRIRIARRGTRGMRMSE